MWVWGWSNEFSLHELPKSELLLLPPSLPRSLPRSLPPSLPLSVSLSLSFHNPAPLKRTVVIIVIVLVLAWTVLIADEAVKVLLL